MLLRRKRIGLLRAPPGGAQARPAMRLTQYSPASERRRGPRRPADPDPVRRPVLARVLAPPSGSAGRYPSRRRGRLCDPCRRGGAGQPPRRRVAAAGWSSGAWRDLGGHAASGDAREGVRNGRLGTTARVHSRRMHRRAGTWPSARPLRRGGPTSRSGRGSHASRSRTARSSRPSTSCRRSGCTPTRRSSGGH